jgi:hypothetical protein
MIEEMKSNLSKGEGGRLFEQIYGRQQKPPFGQEQKQ